MEDCLLEFPADFDKAALGEFRDAVVTKNSWPSERTVEDVLVLRHLGRRQDGRFIPNVACALLFANDPMKVVPGARVRFLRFEGDDISTGERWNAVKDEVIEGTIPQQIERVAAILRSQLREFSRLDKNGQFVTTPEYPEFAWYEGVVNALAHRSYGNGLKNRPVTIRMFDSRLEIESPGPFPPLVTPDNLEHHPRNPFLMDALRYIGYVLMANEGVKRMRTEMARLDLPQPEFIQTDESHSLVRVTLRNNAKQRKLWVDAGVAGLLGEPLVAELTEDEKRCINYVNEYGALTIAHAARITSRDWSTASRMLSRLGDRGILAREGGLKPRDPKARYVLAEKYRKGS